VSRDFLVWVLAFFSRIKGFCRSREMVLSLRLISSLIPLPRAFDFFERLGLPVFVPFHEYVQYPYLTYLGIDVYGLAVVLVPLLLTPLFAIGLYQIVKDQGDYMGTDIGLWSKKKTPSVILIDGVCFYPFWAS